MNRSVHCIVLMIVFIAGITALNASVCGSGGADQPAGCMNHILQPHATIAFADPATTQTAQWWSARAAGLFGAIGGSALGVLGALIGVLGGAFRMWGFARCALNAMIVIGAVCTVVGLYAVFADQPYHVFYPLLLAGVLCLVLGSVLRFTFHAVRRQHELHRMRAMDAS